MRSPLRTGISLALFLALAIVAGPKAESSPPDGSLTPVDLRTEHATNPLGIETNTPRLSWTLAPNTAEARSQEQSAYQILAASNPDLLEPGRADLWDSGKVTSDSSIHVPYRGPSLRSGQRVYWTVRVWDKNDNPSEFSDPVWWEMGLLDAEDWTGEWIKGAHPLPETEKEWYGKNPAPLLRTAFSTNSKQIERARVYVSGLGYYELHLNGNRVGNRVLDPAWVDYAERVPYAVYDVTDQVQQGENAIGVTLGNGWYNPLPLKFFGNWAPREILPVGAPKMRLQLEITYADGTTRTVGSDPNWRTADGPIIKNNIYLGEVYDARMEQPGWTRPGFDDEDWDSARAASPPEGELHAQKIEPIRKQQTVRPTEIIEQKPGVYIVDMGQNFAGWITLEMEGTRGDTVGLRYGERLHDTGHLDVLTSAMTQIKEWGAVEAKDWDEVLSGRFWDDGPHKPQTAWQSDTYVMKGGGEETYTPTFTWHGFRYVEIRGYPGTPTLDDIEGHLLSSDVDTAGTFRSSNELFNETQDATMWSMQSNMFSIQSDCPHRERFGYGGDIVASSEMGLMNLDMSRFYAKTVRDFADAVRPNGGFTEIAPHVGIAVEGLGGGAGPVGWGTAHPMLVWQLYQYYGNRRLMAEQYPKVRRWVELLREKADENILDNGISDHQSLTPKPRALTGTAFYYYNAHLLSKMAEVLGRNDEASEYSALASDIKAAFNREFFDSGTYGIGTQATQAFALYFDLVPEEHEAAAFNQLVSDIEHFEGHLTTGIFATKYLFDVLTEHGRADLAYKVANKSTFSGYGHMLENGATTLWESWENPDQASLNHPMFGSVSEWYYKALLGIQPAEDAVGFDHVIVHPHPVGGMTWAEGHYDSVRGKIESNWTVTADQFTLSITIPVSTTATVHLPAQSRTDISEGGTRPAEAQGISFVEATETDVVYRVESGRYRFVVDNLVRE